MLVEDSTGRPPVNSTPRLSPRAAMPDAASTTAIADTASQRRPCRMRSGFRLMSQLRTRPRLPIPLSCGRRRTVGRLTTESASLRCRSRHALAGQPGWAEAQCLAALVSEHQLFAVAVLARRVIRRGGGGLGTWCRREAENRVEGELRGPAQNCCGMPRVMHSGQLDDDPAIT